MKDQGSVTRATPYQSENGNRGPAVLRVGLVVSSLLVPAWIRAMVEKITLVDTARIVAVVSLESAPTGKASNRESRRFARILRQLCDRIDKTVFERILLRGQPNALAVSDLSPIVGDALRFPVTLTEAEGVVTITDTDRIRIAKLGLDVLINAGVKNLPGALLTIAPLGLWEPFFGEAGRGCSRAPGFYEVKERHPVTISGVRRRSEPQGNDTILCKSSALTYPYSVLRNNNEILWKTSSFVSRLIRRPTTLSGHAGLEPGSSERVPPGDFTVALGTMELWCRLAWSRIRRRLFLEEWSVMARRENGLGRTWDGFRSYLSGRERYWADPFLMFKDGKSYVVMEEYRRPEKRGRIVLARVDHELGLGLPEPILERPYHMSYPFTFSWEGRTYMIPETTQNRSIDLYASSDNVREWTFVMTLMHDVTAYDTTLYFDNTRWWMFTCMVENPGGGRVDELFVFHADHFMTDKWQSHMKNPVVSDATHARPAGALFRENGSLYRPAQNCSGTYGYDVVLCEIQKLNDLEYEEVAKPFADRSQKPRMICAHTLNHSGGITIGDALHRRFRLK
jgi:hypothetical protein